MFVLKLVRWMLLLSCSVINMPQNLNRNLKQNFIVFLRFLLQCLEDLDANLRKLNSRLFVIRGQPANVFPRLFKVCMSSSIQQDCSRTSLMSFPVCVSGMEDLTADIRVRLRAFWEGERCCHQEAGHGGGRGGHCEDITHSLRPGQVRKLSF